MRCAITQAWVAIAWLGWAPAHPTRQVPLRSRVLSQQTEYHLQCHCDGAQRSLRLSDHAEDALRRYRWPGNVRELEHVVSRASLKAVSRGAGRNEIVTLEADMLDLDALELPAGAARRAFTP